MQALFWRCPSPLTLNTLSAFLMGAQDPNSNRIAQWLDLSTLSGMLDLSHPTTAEATLGRYIITVWNEKGQQTSHGFYLKEYGQNGPYMYWFKPLVLLGSAL